MSSFIELHGVQEDVGVPTVTSINASRPEYEAALDGFRLIIDKEREAAARDELSPIMRSGEVRPLGFYKVRVADGFLLLRSPETGRLYLWLNLHSKESDDFELHVAFEWRTPAVEPLLWLGNRSRHLQSGGLCGC